MAYIDTKYLGKCETCRHHSDSGCNTWCDCGEGYSPNMFKIPTADVAEIVYCKDCKKHGSRECIVNQKMDLMGHPTTTKANSFCSEGERK